MDKYLLESLFKDNLKSKKLLLENIGFDTDSFKKRN